MSKTESFKGEGLCSEVSFRFRRVPGFGPIIGLLSSRARHSPEAAKAFQELYAAKSTKDLENFYKQMIVMKDDAARQAREDAARHEQNLIQMADKGFKAVSDVAQGHVATERRMTDKVEGMADKVVASNTVVAGAKAGTPQVVICSKCHCSNAIGANFCQGCREKLGP